MRFTLRRRTRPTAGLVAGIGYRTGVERRRLNGTALAMCDAFSRTSTPWPLPPLTAHKATLEAYR